MANTNNKKKKKKNVPVSTKPQGFKTKRANEKAVIGAAAAVGTAVETSRIIVIVAIIASVALVLLSVLGIFVVSGGSFGSIFSGSGREINYLKANLNRYISFSKDSYKNIEVDIPLLEYDDEHLQRRINALLVENKNTTPNQSGLGLVNKEIGIGDVVKIYYRGYTVDENGKQIEFDGSSNFADDEPYSLEIGSSTFIPGFEDALIGIKPSDYSTFSKITEGNITGDMIVYIGYNATYSNGDVSTPTSKRIDLSRTDLDEEFGIGFRDFIINECTIGTKVAHKELDEVSGGKAEYYDVIVNYATTCEKAIYTIDVTFPADYSESTLRGVAAKFDIFPSSMIDYDVPAFDEKFLTDTLSIKPEDYDGYEGETLVERYKAAIEDELRRSIEVANVTLISDELWKVFKANVKVKRLPKASVKKYYNSYYSEIENYYSTYSSYFSSIDDAAVQYLGLSQGDDWDAYITEMAEDAVLEKVIFFYIIRKEGFLPSDSEYEETYNMLYKEHLDDYIEANGSSLSGLSGEKYDEEYKRLEEKMKETYTDKYFEECVYFEYGTRKMAAELAIIKQA